MSTPIKFGTHGWRGIIAEDLTFANVRVCAQSVALFVQQAGLAERGLVVGYDTRSGSERSMQQCYHWMQSYVRCPTA